ncbi:MAG: peptidase M23 [Marinosulfonomonas sp.]|nr:MAG: peptidase M23 [Marinosulfonomonas sp.]
MRSDEETRFVRLTPASQIMAWTGSAVFVLWSIIATAFLLMDSIGSGTVREQAKREQVLYEMRLNDLSAERDTRTSEALMAQERFNVALQQISNMQVSLLESEDRRKEMETGIEIIQATLQRTMKERDSALDDSEQLTAQLRGDIGADLQAAVSDGDTESTLDFLTAALANTAQERDEQLEIATKAETYAAELELERKLMFERNDRIFEQLEDAVSLSLAPLDKMFEAAGMPTEQILNTVRRGYSGQGGPLMPLTFSTKGEEPDADSLRANSILERMDRMNLYRIAAEKVPFAMPTKRAVRYTSGYGPRNGRLHAGTDMAAPMGTPLYATADGVVKFAGKQSGYGWVVIIQHKFGIETRYAHQSKLRVKKGQRVSRGDRIGDMGNSGRSSGSHVHYEIRVDGKAVNPMTFIKAAKNVF